MQKFILSLIALSTVLASPVRADEGMWLLNNFPAKKLEKKYNVKIDQAWLDHARLSSARLAGGCSGSFVSPDGLVLSNHHCARQCVQDLSTSGKDYIKEGFAAKSSAEELTCPTTEINQLVSITDVTQAINDKTKGLKDQKYNDTLKATLSQIEKDCSKGSEDVRCEVVTLYHGGLYHLYQYRRFQDVRLVFVPEEAMAFFGGDPDNFNFPRYDLDMSFLRVYDHGKPLKSDHYFKWSKTAAKEGDVTFVTGHPGHTERLLTISELEALRDYNLPETIAKASEIRGMLTEYGKRGKEEHRTARDLLFSIENGLKVFKGRLETLNDKKFFEAKKKDEDKLIRSVKAKAEWAKEYGHAWDEVAKAEVQLKDIHLAYNWLEANRAFYSDLYGYARGLVRAAKELPKPNGERLREFTDSKLPELKQRLFSTAPVYPELETTLLDFSLTKLRENLKADHAVVKRIFAKESPEDLAARLVKGTKLQDVAFRKKLFEGGWPAIQASTDPMIQFALSLDDDSRAVRKIYEDQIESVLKKNGEKIAKARFLVNGSDTYPDATFTLRISYGKIEGYNENGKFVKPITTLGGAFERNTGYDPFALPESWLAAKSKIDMATPLNFCSTNDIIGGNSGSPVINAKGEVVGLIFDGNIQSLGGDFGYESTQNRAIAVHSTGIIEALKKIYGADRLVSELLPQ